jgi:hypothetical protein
VLGFKLNVISLAKFDSNLFRMFFQLTVITPVLAGLHSVVPVPLHCAFIKLNLLTTNKVAAKQKLRNFIVFVVNMFNTLKKDYLTDNFQNKTVAFIITEVLI